MQPGKNPLILPHDLVIKYSSKKQLPMFKLEPLKPASNQKLTYWLYPNSLHFQERSLLPCHPSFLFYFVQVKDWEKSDKPFFPWSWLGPTNIPLGKCAKGRIIHPTKLIHLDLDSLFFFSFFFLYIFCVLVPCCKPLEYA